MRCPFCKKHDDKVIDSRSAAEGAVIRRRRECLSCGRRFTTYEKVEAIPFQVIKKDGTRVSFDRECIHRGMLKACEKRPVSSEELERIVDSIESKVHEMFDREVASKFIGNLVMEALKELDQVAYVRFASVYREFKDVGEFMRELEAMLGKTRHGKD
ncbi:MAG TPA: transcriptional repressor NrdR [Planctomycetes bacterium]|nr:transcriptional repressor NrdR [Planctomycetota bacterium]